MLIIPLTSVYSHDNLAAIMRQTCRSWVGMDVIDLVREKEKCPKSVMLVRSSGSMQPRDFGSLDLMNVRMYVCTSPPFKWKDTSTGGESEGRILLRGGTQRVAGVERYPDRVLAPFPQVPGLERDPVFVSHATRRNIYGFIYTIIYKGFLFYGHSNFFESRISAQGSIGGWSCRSQANKVRSMWDLFF